GRGGEVRATGATAALAVARLELRYSYRRICLLRNRLQLPHGLTRISNDLKNFSASAGFPFGAITRSSNQRSFVMIVRWMTSSVRPDISRSTLNSTPVYSPTLISLMSRAPLAEAITAF